jgi:hypothetical protein
MADNQSFALVESGGGVADSLRNRLFQQGECRPRGRKTVSCPRASLTYGRARWGSQSWLQAAFQAAVLALDQGNSSALADSPAFTGLFWM